jgi:SHS2 domain-containing protein
MSSSAGAAGGAAEFTALPPRDCIRKRTRRPADQVPVVVTAAAASAVATTAAGDARRPLGAAAGDEAQEEQEEQAEQAEQEEEHGGGHGAAGEAGAANGGSGRKGGAREEGRGDAPAAAAAAAAAAPASSLDLPAYRSCAERGRSFEYLDHTADVQIHAWGATLEEALESAGLAMFNYMTPLSGVRAPPPPAGDGDGECERDDGDGGGNDGGFRGRTFVAEGHDADSLVFAFLDELLFAFASDLAVCSELKVTKLTRGGSGAEGGGAGDAAGGGEEAAAAAAAAKAAKWRVEAVGSGERFDRERHEAGTEIKAITYSAMQVIEKEGDAEIFVIVDI